MKRSVSVGIVACALLSGALIGCHKIEPADGAEDSPRQNGHYVGIGIYDPGELWAKMVAAPPSKTPPPASSATIDDDTKIIVVVDSRTGEIRQCGNLSGHCVGMNPWTKALLATDMGAVNLTKHAADIRAELEAKQAEAEKAAAHK